MARGKTRVHAAASINFSYQSSGEMPWAAIEAAAGRPFRSEEREEIFYCAEGFDWEHDYFAQAPVASELEHLRANLTKHCQALVDLASKYPPELNTRMSAPPPDYVSALQIHFGTEGFVPRDEYAALARVASKMVEGLKVPAAIDMSTTALSPETAGLRAFIQRVLAGAEKVEARSTRPGSWSATGYEYRRWGIPVGKRVKSFPGFVSAVLSRDIAPDKLRYAWPEDR